MIWNPKKTNLINMDSAPDQFTHTLLTKNNILFSNKEINHKNQVSGP